jgi:predicted ArsR family transcriptional regulator
MTATTRTEILTLLKRTGGRSVGELASDLGLADISVRQQLVRLERDGLLKSERAAGQNGRPHYVYRLTAKAHAAAFPRRTDRLIELLVREIGALHGQELLGLSEADKKSLVLMRVAQRLASEYAPLLKEWSVSERVAFVTEVMHADGGLAEWERTARGYEIRDYNCPFARLMTVNSDDACQWHQYLLENTLDVEVQAIPCSDTVGQCCRFAVLEPSSTQNGTAPTVSRETMLA